MQAVFAFLGLGFELECVVAKSGILKHFRDDFLRAEVLENAVVVAERQPPQPRAQHKLIADSVAVCRKQARFGDQPVVVSAVYGGGKMGRQRGIKG